MLEKIINNHMINFNSLKGKVEWCLKNDPQSRNSDIRLYGKLLLSYYIYKSKLINTNGQYSIPLKNRYDLPKEEDVCRIRRWFNNKGFYKPTSKEVIKQRKLQEKVWHDEMQPSNPSFF